MLIIWQAQAFITPMAPQALATRLSGFTKEVSEWYFLDIIT